MSPELAPSIPLWVSLLIAAGTLVFGGGGVATLMKAHNDKKQGIEAHELAEDNALSERWERLVERQTRVLLEPLEKRVSELNERVRELEIALDGAQRRYWKAITHIRQLQLWIVRHMPPGVESAPEAPSEIMEDI